MNEALKLFKTAIFPRYSCFEWGKLYEREWVCYVLCLSLWTPCEYGSWQTGQAARVLKSPRLLRTLCELHSTSKANLPLPGDAHGLIRYLVSALMRSGLYHWGGMSRGTMRARNTCRKRFQIMSVMCCIREAETCHYRLLPCEMKTTCSRCFVLKIMK